MPHITPPPGAATMFDHQPDAWAAFNRFYGTLWTAGAVPQPVKEAGRIRNARLVDCGI